MGVPDTSLLDLNGKDKTLLSRSGSDYSSQMAEINMDENMFGICSDCELKFIELSHKFFCRGCGRTFCSTCICRSGSLVIIAASDSVVKGCVLKNIIKSCKFCIRASKRRIEKIYPSESPRESPEPPSPCSGREKVMNGRDAEATIETDHVYDDPAGAEHDISIYAVSNNNTISSIPNHLPPISVCGSQICATEDCRKYMFEPSRDHCHDSSDVDSCSVVSLRHECCSCKSSDSSPADSPSRINISYPRVGDSVHHEKEGSLTSHVDGTFDHRRVLLVKPERRTTNPANSKSGADHLSILQSLEEKYQQPLDFENNDNLWFPPPPEHEDDETGGNFFEYDDDDDEIGESRGVFSSSGDLSSLCSVNEKQSDVPEEPLSSAVHSHFRALVSQLLQGEDIKVTNENESEDWLGVVSNLAWLAAKSVKPDTKKGGSMDPGDYIKIKCLASGKPSQSTLVKGVVCTKNIKHKRMTSQYKNPRLLLLGGSLEYARVPNQLASFSTIFEEESDQLKLIVSRIEAHHTNVLLVEKSVSPIAQEYLLDKDISLVLNVKRTLLDRIARCTGASITPSVDNIKSSSLGHCEHFRLEKVFEELEATKQPNKRPSKTLMFFEGCPRRLGCTILLKGSYREELKKIKKVIQYAVFAAYHLSLETSFLADEGASLPKMTLQPLSFVPEHTSIGNLIPAIANSALDDGLESSTEHLISVSASMGRDDGPKVIASEGYVDGSVSDSAGGSCFMEGYEDTLVLPASEVVNIACSESPESPMVEALQHEELERVGEREVSADYFSAQESSQSLLVSFSSRCVLKGTVCERSRLLRIKFYGSFDKPLGRYLRDDLFDQASYCRSCKEPIESHVQCYTHQQGSLTINVRRMAAKKLPGQQDGKIWMWHRCLRCAQVDGYPPATHRVVMSDAAWGLSFGKFLELSFSNHTTANRIASCGHSMQRDCLRFYGCGDMVAFFHYSPIKILSVRLPPSVLEFDGLSKQQWLKKEATELKSKMETLYLEMADILHDIEQKGVLSANGFSDLKDFSKHIVGLKDLLDKEKDEYYVLLHEEDKETPQSVQNDVDILELNSLRHSLLLASRVWEHRFYCLDSLLKSGSSAAALLEAPWSLSEDTESDGDRPVENAELLETEQSSLSYISSPLGDPNLEFNVSENYNLDSRSQEEISKGNEVMEHEESFERSASSISDKIDSAWIGTYLQPVKSHATHLQSEAPPRAENLPVKRLIAPARVYSFDSATRLRERFHKASYPSSLRVRSFHATGEHKSMARDPAFDVLRTYSQIPPHEIQRLSSGLGSPASYISSAAQVTEGARLLLPQMARSNLVIAVYDDEPTSLISYALSSNEHEDWVSNKLNGHERSLSVSDMNGDEFSASSISPWQSLGSADLDYMGSEDLLSPKISSFFYGAKKSPHLRVSFEDDSSSTMGKAKFSVTCYFAKQFEMLRRKCCPSEVDIVSSLSRCKKWSAQGGKSNVYFAKSLDERFIVKQVSKTELESFGEFASEYFRYLNESLSSRSPTCLAKVLGIYQVSVRNMRGGKETKMDVMVMENLFFKKSVSRIYDLKGSSRSRYNADTSGKNNVLLDMNLLETLRTDPIFLGSKAKRSLERAIWNDTAFLASVDVMDYSLLVGVDEEKRELVVGIIDYMRQYTWDKHLETWVKASGILGGPKNASPTIVSPMQYKKRFRKAMTTYFLTVPDQLLS